MRPEMPVHYTVAYVRFLARTLAIVVGAVFVLYMGRRRK
jgi:hypothetical protein